MEWYDDYNIKDYSAVFLDLFELYRNPSKYDPPSFSSDKSISFPKREAVDKHTKSRNDIFVRLPLQTEISIPSQSGIEASVNLLNWLPFEIQTDSSEQGENINVPIRLGRMSDKPPKRDWKWYFSPPQFHWKMRLMGIRPWPENQSSFRNSTMQKITDGFDMLARQSGTPEKGKLNGIAKNNTDEVVAGEIQFSHGIQYSGSIYLLPPRKESFSDFVVGILQNWYGYNASYIRTETAPLWEKDVATLGKSNLSTRLSELELQIQSAKEEFEKREEYKKLLYTNNTTLENLVIDAFREFGFQVDGEYPGKWDGVIKFQNRDYLLEVTGTGGGIKDSKLSQLDRHIRDYSSTRESENEVYSILIANISMNDPPSSRKLNKGNFIGDISGTNKLILTTNTLYRILNAFFENEISDAEIKKIICDADSIIQFQDEYTLWNQPDAKTRFSQQISKLRRKLSYLI
ncbi:hypothetical protein [Haladaptatus sp. CMSO5]|uniref:hypothetical protein n=1 Tax=Haladaptatus sp. CMSO5 TaxID=3120514 RepID=UPI002FCE1B7F